MWPFKPKKAWTNFRPLKQCGECGRLQEPGSMQRAVDFMYDNCPDCGSKDVKEVVGRWEVSYDMFFYPTYYRSEVIEAAKKETA